MQEVLRRCARVMLIRLPVFSFATLLVNSSTAQRSSRVFRVAHPSHMLFSGSRRNNLIEKLEKLHGVPRV